MFKRFFFSVISVLFFVSVCPDNVYGRRSQAVYTVLNYDNLLYKIETGEKLVSTRGNVLVRNHGDTRNLAHLNDIPRYYRGSEGIYWLALDLELAIKEGYIDFYRDISSFDSTQLNKLSDSFRDSLGLNKAYFGWEKFLNLRNKLYSDPGDYSDNEGLICLAFEGDAGSLTQLYDAFSYKAEELNWQRLNCSLSKLKRAKQLFEKHSLDITLEEYGGLEGLELLADRSGIDNPEIVYYARHEFENYDSELFNWEVDEYSNNSSISSSLSNRLNKLNLSNTNSYYINAIGLENVRHLLEINDKAIDIIANFALIDDHIERVSTMYGSRAQGLSETDKMVYRDYLNNIDNSVRDIMERVNMDIITVTLGDSSLSTLTLEAQEDFLLALEVLSSFQDGRLTQSGISGSSRHRNDTTYLFSAAELGCNEIVLALHDQETDKHESCIRWKMNRGEDSVRLLLERKRRDHDVMFTVGSSAINRVYKELSKRSHYGFMLNVPELNSEANFKWLVRVFY